MTERETEREGERRNGIERHTERKKEIVGQREVGCKIERQRATVLDYHDD